MVDSIAVRVRAFAGLREALGTGDLSIDVPAGTDVTGLLAQLESVRPGANLAERRFAVAVNRAYVHHDTVLQAGDEIALIPPVSGGSTKLFEITAQPLSLDEAARRVAAPERGGVAAFGGTVRGVTGDLTTDYLEYEAYPEMAEAVLAQIGAEVQERWPQVNAVSIIHRVGRLEVGDLAVVIAVAAGHREGIFAACEYAINRVKQVAPIWKKEVGGDGAMWVEGPESLP